MNTNTAYSVHIYSDVSYGSYQHVNQMMHRYLRRCRVDSVFLDRLVMNLPGWRHVAAVANKFTARRPAATAAPLPDVSGVRKLVNLPSVCVPVDYLNEWLILRQLRSDADTAITFVPSLALKRVLARYPDLVVPPPIPDCFFMQDFATADKAYDAIYFGSLHKDIDQETLHRLAHARLRVAIVSSQRLGFDSPWLSYLPLQTELALLARLVAKARCVLPPYKNTDFMLTISPAKIHQAVATGLPVFSSNSRLCREFNLLSTAALNGPADLDRHVKAYVLSNARKAQLAGLRESVLLKRVAGLLVQRRQSPAPGQPAARAVPARRSCSRDGP